ncbi:MAG: hypothetical protein E7H38_07985 [Varibaculum cambriense]|uniref:FDXHR family putative zinc-binding protein n=1 Tax=Varibaculum cambriense TaxID=184870 RepID=UPI00290755E2|nr:hypothetical protein [Varibaculum cambriense]MDU4028294.1 hypothetical protein [Varibaculum cambriense]
MKATCKCGKTWIQHGNSSGHCAKCHETFYGIASFDNHFNHDDQGKPICLPVKELPPTLERRGWLADEEGQWHMTKIKTDARTWNEYRQQRPHPLASRESLPQSRGTA